MSDTTTDTTGLASIRRRREALHEAVVGLEDALAGPVGEGDRWRLRVAMAVDHAVARIGEHINETEGPGNILDDIRQVAPRLSRQLDQMKKDHERLEKTAHELALAVADLRRQADTDAVEGSEERAYVVRNQAIEMMGQIARHRQRGSDLLYEAYHVDLGNSA